MERPEPLVVEAKIIDRHQSYDAWRAVSLCVSAEGVDVTPLNDPSARVRVVFPSIKGVRKLEEHIVEFEWRVPADASHAKKTAFFCPNPVEPIRVKFTASVQYLIQQRKRNASSDAAKSAAGEPDKAASSPRSGTGLLSFLFTNNKDDKPGSTPPLPLIPASAVNAASADSAVATPEGEAVHRPISPVPVAAVPREGSKSALSALLNWGSAADEAPASVHRSGSGRGGSGRALANPTPPPASQPEKPGETLPPQTRSALGFGTLFRGSWGERKDAPPPIDPKVVETLQKEIKDLEAALKEANHRHQEAAHRLESLQHLDPILTAADEKANLASKKILEADARVAETEQKVRALEAQLTESTRRVTEMSEVHAALQAKARNADDWERRTHEVEAKLATAEATLTTTQNHYDSAIPKLVAAENRVRDAETRAIDAGRKAKEAQDEVQRLRALLKEAEKTLEQQSHTIQGLEKRLDAAGRLVRAAEKHGDIAQAQLAKAPQPAALAEDKKEAKPAEETKPEKPAEEATKSTDAKAEDKKEKQADETKPATTPVQDQASS